MVLGMLGGSFCPPTKAHIDLSNLCVKKGLCDKVIWVPVNEAYKKSTNIAAYHRIEMVKLALKNEENIDYSLHEQNYKDIIRTFESVKVLQQIYPDDKIVFIAGADKLGFKWMQREEFVRDFGYIILSRDDINCDKIINSSSNLIKWRNNIKFLDYNSEISSTLVRNQINELGYSNLIPKTVMQYVKENNLFME